MDKPLYQNAITNSREWMPKFIPAKSRRLSLLLFCFCISLGANAQFEIDATFANAGQRVFSIDNYDESVDIVTLNNDTLLLAGNTVHADSIFDADVFIVKLLPDGKNDTSFGSEGLLRFDFNGFDFSTANEILKMPLGEVYLLGSGYSTANNTYVPFCIAKIKADGRIDSSYGINGTLNIDFAGLHETAKSIEADSNGMILISGSTVDTTDLHSEVPVIARLLADGTPDNTFGEGGKVYLRFPQGIVQDRSDRHLIGGLIQDLLVLPDGRIIAAGGYSNTLNLVAFFVCLNTDGSIDSSFFDDGYLALDLTQGYNSDVVKLALKGSELFFAAESSTSVMRDFYFGKLDINSMTYDVDAIDFQLNEDIAKDMLLTQTGEIFFCGNSISPAHNTTGYQSDYFEIAGLTKQNYPFGSTAKAFAVNPNFQNGATAMAAQTNNRLVCAGFVNTANNESDIALLGVNKTYSAISNPTIETSCKIFPNPATDKVIVHFNAPLNEVEVSLYTAQVQLIDVTRETNTSSISITRGNLSSGSYWLQLRTREVVEYHQIIFK